MSSRPSSPLAGRDPASSYELIKGDRSSFLSMSDDKEMMTQILATHAAVGREDDVKPLLRIVEGILNRATLDTSLMTTPAPGEMEEKANLANLVGVIDELSCEISYKALGGTEAAHRATLAIFEMLSSHHWDAKLVLTLTAFALQYGEFWLLGQTRQSNELARLMAIVRQPPAIMEHTGPLKAQFDELNNLIKSIMNVTKCVVELNDLPPEYIPHEQLALQAAIANVPTTVYWTIRSVVTCVSQLHILKLTAAITTREPVFTISTDEALELSTLVHRPPIAWTSEPSTLAHKLNNIYEHLRKQLDICYGYIEGKRNDEYTRYLKSLFEMIHIDNMKVLKALINVKDDPQPILDGATKRRVSLDMLKRKNVLLLISGLAISQDELSILEQIFNESRLHATRLDTLYEVLWIPIVDPSIKWTEAHQKQFDSLQTTMPWFSVHHPKLIQRPVIKFIQEEWRFRNKPILVVLDPQGKVACRNAFHMMWIWGSTAFPFTSAKEEALWRDESWRVELLVDDIDPMILNWIKDGKYIFLYGGDDVEWVRKFANSAKAVASAARVPLEMVYVGKSNKRELVRRVLATITVEKLSYCWQDLTMTWFFWTRLHSMLFSKIQLDKVDEHDPMMHEIKKLISYDREGGWAVFAKGSTIFVNGPSSTMLTTLVEYDLWKDQIPVKGLEIAFKEHHDKLRGVAHTCSHFDFPMNAGHPPASMKCPECHRLMEKFITFSCCHDEGIPTLE